MTPQSSIPPSDLSWVEILRAAREYDMDTLASLGMNVPNNYPPQEGVTDRELVQQLVRLGSKEHSLYPRIVREIYVRTSKTRGPDSGQANN